MLSRLFFFHLPSVVLSHYSFCSGWRQNGCNSFRTKLQHKRANNRRESEFGHMLIPEPLELSLDLWFSTGGDLVPQHLAMCTEKLGCHKWEETKNYPGQDIKSVMVEKFYLRQSESLMNLGIGFASSEEYSCLWEKWISQQNKSSTEKE